MMVKKSSHPFVSLEMTCCKESPFNMTCAWPPYLPISRPDTNSLNAHSLPHKLDCWSPLINVDKIPIKLTKLSSGFFHLRRPLNFYPLLAWANIMQNIPSSMTDPSRKAPYCKGRHPSSTIVLCHMLMPPTPHQVPYSLTYSSLWKKKTFHLTFEMLVDLMIRRFSLLQ